MEGYENNRASEIVAGRLGINHNFFGGRTYKPSVKCDAQSSYTDFSCTEQNIRRKYNTMPSKD